ncbi:hypothetical protein ACFWWS_39680 [Streptomyces sp. NPDC059083]|uniref:hypothetical protein n=1 Tax=Streptomyces sp. NPDC059083 TaxID=3346721 RepID=UPI00367FBB7F
MADKKTEPVKVTDSDETPITSQSLSILEGISSELRWAASNSPYTAKHIRDIIENALLVPGPWNLTVAIAEQAQLYHATAMSVQTTHDDLQSVQLSKHEAWRGHAAESAGDQIAALIKQSSAIQKGYMDGFQALDEFRSALKRANGHYNDGWARLAQAKAKVDQMTYTNQTEARQQGLYNSDALPKATVGCQSMIDGLNQVKTAFAQANRGLEESVKDARGHVSGWHMTPLTVAALSYADKNAMSLDDVTTASRSYDLLTPDTRKRFDDSIAAAKSKEEAVTLWRNLPKP